MSELFIKWWWGGIGVYNNFENSVSNKPLCFRLKIHSICTLTTPNITSLCFLLASITLQSLTTPIWRRLIFWRASMFPSCMPRPLSLLLSHLVNARDKKMKIYQKFQHRSFLNRSKATKLWRTWPRWKIGIRNKDVMLIPTSFECSFVGCTNVCRCSLK